MKKCLIIGVVLIIALSGVLTSCSGNGGNGEEQIGGYIQVPDGPKIKVVFSGPPELKMEWEKLGMADMFQVHLIGTMRNVSNKSVKFSEIGFLFDGWQVDFIQGRTLEPSEEMKILKGFPGYNANTKVLEVKVKGFEIVGGSVTTTSGTTIKPADFETWAETAIEWAQNNLGSDHWYELCLRFTANAFMQQGEPPSEIPEGIWTSALDAINGDEDYDLILKDPDSWNNAPRGALIFFSKTEENQFGHVGIYLGDGRIIHSYGKVRIDDVEQVGELDRGRLIGSYLGWTYPPERWRPKSTTSKTMEPAKPDVTPSSDELFILETEGIYRETSSAKGKLKIIVNEVKYSPSGEKYWLMAFQNITNRVLDIELFVDWKDPSGKSLETETQRDQRFLPEDTSGDEFEFPRGALGAVFWINVKYPEPIPQKIDFSYIDTSSTKGTIDIQNPIIEIHKEGTVYEQWIVPRLEVRNTSKNIILEFEGYFEFYSGGIIMEEQTLAFQNSSPLEPSISCDIIGGDETTFQYGVGDSYGWGLDSIFIPYEADELRLSIGVTKVLPLEVTINYNVGPGVEQYYQVTFDSPVIYEGRGWMVQEGRNWAVQGEFIQTKGYDIYSDDRIAVFEIRVEFDTGQGKLAYYREGYVPPSTNIVEGNPVVAEVKIDRLYSREKSFDIIYPTEATRAEVRINFIGVQKGLN